MASVPGSSRRGFAALSSEAIGSIEDARPIPEIPEIPVHPRNSLVASHCLGSELCCVYKAHAPIHGPQRATMGRSRNLR